MARLDHLQSGEEARRAAARRLPRMPFDCIGVGTGEERTTARNCAALACIEQLPRVLVDVTDVRTHHEFLDRHLGGPIGIAPMAMCDLTWPGARFRREDLRPGHLAFRRTDREAAPPESSKLIIPPVIPLS